MEKYTGLDKRHSEALCNERLKEEDQWCCVWCLEGRAENHLSKRDTYG